MAGGQRVGGRGVVVGSRVVGPSAGGLEPDQVAEHLVGEEVVALRESDELRADGVTLRGEAGAVAGLHEDAVEGERQQRRIVETTGERLGLGAASRGRGVARHGTRARSWRAAERGCSGGPARQHPLGRSDDRGRLRRVVGPGPDRRYVVRADDPGGQVGVAELLGGGDGREAMPPSGLQPAAAGDGEVAQQADGRLEPGPRSADHAVVGRGRLGPHAAGRRELLGVVEDVALQPAQRRTGIDAELPDERVPGPTQYRESVVPAARSGTAPTPAAASRPHATGARRRARRGPARPRPRARTPAAPPRSAPPPAAAARSAASARPAPTPRRRSPRTPDPATRHPRQEFRQQLPRRQRRLHTPPRTATRPRRRSAARSPDLRHQQPRRRPRRPVRFERPPQRGHERPQRTHRARRRIHPQVVDQSSRRYDATPSDDAAAPAPARCRGPFEITGPRPRPPPARGPQTPPSHGTGPTISADADRLLIRSRDARRMEIEGFDVPASCPAPTRSR